MANSLTWGTMRKEACNVLGDVDASGNPLYNRYNELILMAYANDILGEIFSEQLQLASWTIRAVKEQSSYSYPNDCLNGSSVWYDNTPLFPLPRRQVYEKLGGVKATDSGTPNYVDFQGDYFWLYPTPDATDDLADETDWKINLWGVCAADKETMGDIGVVSRPITDANSPIIIENTFADLLKDGIIAKCKDADGDLEHATRYWNLFQQRLATYRHVMLARQGVVISPEGPEY